jgi:hypothetical protein
MRRIKRYRRAGIGVVVALGLSGFGAGQALADGGGPQQFPVGQVQCSATGNAQVTNTGTNSVTITVSGVAFVSCKAAPNQCVATPLSGTVVITPTSSPPDVMLSGAGAVSFTCTSSSPPPSSCSGDDQQEATDSSDESTQPTDTDTQDSQDSCQQETDD